MIRQSTNGNGNLYIVLFGNDRFYPDLHIKNAEYQLSYLADARRIARRYSNAYIFKAHFGKYTGDLLWITEVKR